ncbi:hypothetical protein HDEF_1748 [Candidatus Hamiltonella defensa 5AT (Acyrthosiphon pisum)]|uniref:Uncharacterized protein n=1 Tax=Hamiltonella defensa subsp. Acyrthosiphon pisum (strain 5AT) TaxID=572265 RepID=C4K706_HAMD5|nr:hypothetical protein HDEF_1748 [Candidatus Hamiltonella defensa 5AT (Acyrthosiphon pisum)]
MLSDAGSFIQEALEHINTSFSSLGRYVLNVIEVR